MSARGFVTKYVLTACCAAATALAAQHAAAQSAKNRSVATVDYTTRSGDTLYDVSARYLQGTDDWPLVAQLNDVPVPKHLQPGVVLKLPAARLRKERLSARVIAAHGTVESAGRGSAQFAPVAVDATLTEGDRLRTGSNAFVTLELSDGTHLSLPPDSQIDLATLRRTVLTGTLERVIDLRRGSVDSEVTHLKKKDDRFQIRSPSVVAGVRGTRFRVNYDKDGRASTTVEVLDGTVGVAPSAKRSADTLVHANFGNVTSASGVVGSPIALLDAPQLANPAKIQDDPQVAFDLVPLGGAQSYHVQIARDAGLYDLFKEVQVPAPRATFADVPDGTYFVRIAAIDSHGLEGQPRIYAFERRRFGVDASAAPADGGYAFRWSTTRDGAAAGATRFRFVLSRSKDLSNPIVDQVDAQGGRIAVSNLTPGDYYWSVIAERYEGGRFHEKASAVNAFTIAR
ncbi:LysM domain-containing protein [Burkholderia pseudomallei]|uniref:FecR domain-containing protein n=1 Tax=Burkholderia pseudomallei TaxID=28450 RepID=UPI000F06696A|nr:FecR domain-containing protein [Burkholderia pseudomallei]MWA18290.1 LysM peptidoglycan-binding domain-containing protein [Burkholderia pseudomallei]MWA23951.1 LysM peptidoglycan-binding domain-containing protein [Burkholderia pseudomallei]CAJ2739260.1 LysM domain-containing protein [Burkholderia pseudomallei]VCA70175.1 LysM domain-containing protein [Burkholderia pseudomallei]VCA94166.1 LysM domain-containing protein [Burkholderia pseudomallei]